MQIDMFCPNLNESHEYNSLLMKSKAKNDKKQNKKRLDVNFYPIYLDQYMWHDHEEIRILLKCERTAGGNLKKKGLSCQRLFDE